MMWRFRQLSDFECVGPRNVMWNIVFFNTGDAGVRWTAPDRGFEARDGGSIPFHHHLDRPITLVAHPAPDLERRLRSLNEPAEYDPLHPAAHHEPHRAHLRDGA